MVGRNDVENSLKALLQLKPGSTTTLKNRESSALEFKESFNWGSRSKYAKTMAAFSNARGGYIVFGVKPAPHTMVGINSGRMESFDPSQITQYLNTYFSPEINWNIGATSLEGFNLAFIYTHEGVNKPTVCTQNGDELKEGSIYYRYSAQTSVIKYPELRLLIEEMKLMERRAWMQHLKVIGEAGPTNVGVLDTLHGKLFGAGKPMLIDEKLLREVKLIREGSFSETDGAPTLRLVGEVRTAAGFAKEREVPVSIHFDDLVTAFLAERELSVEDSRTYLKEVSYQSTPYIPIHFFIVRSKLSKEAAISFLKESASGSRTIRDLLIKRLSESDGIKPLEKVGTLAGSIKDSAAEFVGELNNCKSAPERRALLLIAVRKNPMLISESILDSRMTNLLESITHLKSADVRGRTRPILDLMLQIHARYFPKMTAPEKTKYRRAIAILDQLAYG